MAKSEIVEGFLYGRATWASLEAHWNKLRIVHHTVCCFEPSKSSSRSPDNRILSKNDGLQQTACENIETTVRSRRLSCAEALSRTGDHRLTPRMMPENLDNA